MIKSDFYTFFITLLDVHVIRGQSQDRAFREHARISLNLAHRVSTTKGGKLITGWERQKGKHNSLPSYKLEHI